MTANVEIDPVSFELTRHALGSIVDEMGLAIVRTAFSNVIKEVLDFATIICDARGQLIAHGPSLPLHMGPMPDAMAAVLNRFQGRINPGDIYLLNDPYEGGTHLPDFFIIKPYFHGDRLLAFLAISAHHADVGGRAPSSMAYDSTEIYQEGFRFPPFKLYDRGVQNDLFFEILACNSRLPDKVLGDLRGQLAACHIGESRFAELVEMHGPDELESQFAQLLAYSEQLTRAEIGRMPKGVFEFTDYIDDDGFDPQPLALPVRLTIRDDEIEVDFRDAPRQARGAINVPASYTKALVYATLRCAIEADIPNNSGYFRPIKVLTRPGSILHPQMPAAVAMRGQTAYRLADVMFGALGKVLPHKVFAAGEGGTSHIRIAGDRPEGGRFIFMDVIQGTWGARPDKDGVDGVGNIISNLSNTPVEVIEAEFPLRIQRYALADDSGGAGTYRGGLSVVRQIELLADQADLQVRTDRQKFPPFGLAGGHSGRGARFVLNPEGETEELPTKTNRVLKRGDVIRHDQASGGGYGDPLERDPEAVRADVLDDKVSVVSAASVYGVALEGPRLEVNAERTAAQRERLRAEQSAQT